MQNSCRRGTYGFDAHAGEVEPFVALVAADHGTSLILATANAVVDLFRRVLRLLRSLRLRGGRGSNGLGLHGLGGTRLCVLLGGRRLRLASRLA
jgi:hypothetical protein